MKKALFLAITCVVLASCGGKATEAAAETPAEAAEAVVADTAAVAVDTAATAVADTTAAKASVEVKAEEAK